MGIRRISGLRRLKNVAGFCLSLGLFCSGFLHAETVVFSDDFTGVGSANLNDTGWYFTHRFAAAKPWITTTKNTSLLSGTVMSNSGPSSNTGAYKQFPAVSLNAIGDSITVRMDFQIPNTAAGFYSVALLSTANTITEDVFGGEDPISDASGYGTRQEFLNGPTSNSYREIDHNAWAGSVLADLDSAGDAASENVEHSYVFTITKVDSGLQLDSSLDGVTLESFTMTGAPQTSFNTLRLVGAMGNSGFHVDNVVVSTSSKQE
jgi:hypothetical protein